MTPQDHFMVVAPIAGGREAALRALLDTMNLAPGRVDPDNAVLPFAAFEGLHFARLVVLDATTLDDLAVFGLPRPTAPPYLALMGDCDGPGRAMLAALAREAPDGLRRLFAHCEDFDASGDLLGWLIVHDLPVQARYVNTLGRTVRQIREESALQRALSARVPRGPPATDLQTMRRELIASVDAEIAAGALSLAPPAPTPSRWRLDDALHLIGLPLFALALAPLALVIAPFALIALRLHETRDPEYCPRPDADALRAMQRLEDHDVTNSFTAIGPVKPGGFRLVVLRLVLFALDWLARHVFQRGFLTRIQTIHFARWVFVDDRRRVLFASSYDGAHEAYMDDFVNKVGWGLNVVFSNGFGWPHTDWLVAHGARREMPFKRYQRRHQVPTQVWYKAYPGLTLGDLARNAKIRAGFEATSLDDRETLAWLKLL